MKTKKKYCLACEIRGKKVEATENEDGIDLCIKHAELYRGKFDQLINK